MQIQKTFAHDSFRACVLTQTHTYLKVWCSYKAQHYFIPPPSKLSIPRLNIYTFESLKARRSTFLNNMKFVDRGSKLFGQGIR